MTSIYFAPLEGITGFAFRNTHYAAFASVEKYYTPFTAPNYTHHWKTRDREDVDPAHNKDIPLIPQILTNRADDFLWAAGELVEMGYREINLNLGCPMPTVVKKHRGSGQLEDLDALDLFLEQICTGMEKYGLSDEKGNSRTGNGETGNDEIENDEIENDETKNDEIKNDETGNDEIENEKTGNVEKTCSEGKLRFSIKTRIGLRTAENAAELLKIYNRYPLCELIVHPRTQTDLYKGTPDLETFEMILEDSAHPVVYNGDIFTIEDYTELITRFPECPAVMIGRGLIANPALAREIRGGAPLEKEELRRYHDSLYTALRQTLPGAAPLIGKMKELWFYMGRNFADSDRFLKEIRKARDLVRYEAAVRTLFAQGKFLPGKKITF